MPKLTLVLGGIKSGKSNFAQELAAESNNVTYLATAQATDEEMKQKIAEHKKNRPSNWETVEINDGSLDKCLKAISANAVLIDCLGNLITSSFEDKSPDVLINEITETLKNLKDNFDHIIMVSNEVGLSLVSPYKGGRDFSNVLGKANQEIAKIADEVYLLVAGVPMQIKQIGEKV